MKDVARSGGRRISLRYRVHSDVIRRDNPSSINVISQPLSAIFLQYFHNLSAIFLRLRFPCLFIRKTRMRKAASIIISIPLLQLNKIIRSASCLWLYVCLSVSLSVRLCVCACFYTVPVFSRLRWNFAFHFHWRFPLILYIFFIPAIGKLLNWSRNQSINQSINRSINQSFVVSIIFS